MSNIGYSPEKEYQKEKPKTNVPVKAEKKTGKYPLGDQYQERGHFTIIESFSWLSPEFQLQKSTDGKTVKIQGRAIPKNAISKNQRAYVADEMHSAARTFIDVPVTVNHAKWSDPKNKKGKVNWMEYDMADGNMEFVGEVWNPEIMTELRLYKENPSASRIRGVSIEADFLYLTCSVCGEKFTNEEAWHKHMTEVERLKDVAQVPHGIRGRALSLVLAPEVPGVEGNTLEVISEVKNKGFFDLMEMVLKEKGGDAMVTKGKTSLDKPKSNLHLAEPCSPELRACVDDLIADGKDESSAWAICKNQLGETKTKEQIRQDALNHFANFCTNHPDPKVKEEFNLYLQPLNEMITEGQSLINDSPLGKQLITEQKRQNDLKEQEVKAQEQDMEQLKAENEQLKNEVATLKQELEDLKRANDSKLTETTSLQETIKTLHEDNKQLAETVLAQEKKLEKETVRADNAEDKLGRYSEFKGHSIALESESTKQTDFSYTPTDNVKRKEK